MPDLSKYESKLLPCPFCGGRAEMYGFRQKGKDAHRAQCGLADCPVIVRTVGFDTPEEAAEEWNRRAAVEWQPMETAPRDGTRILVVWCGDVTVATWRGELDDTVNDDGEVLKWQEWPDGDFDTGGEVTAWMPLPEVPENLKAPWRYLDR